MEHPRAGHGVNTLGAHGPIAKTYHQRKGNGGWVSLSRAGMHALSNPTCQDHDSYAVRQALLLRGETCQRVEPGMGAFQQIQLKRGGQLRG